MVLSNQNLLQTRLDPMAEPQKDISHEACRFEYPLLMSIFVSAYRGASTIEIYYLKQLGRIINASYVAVSTEIVY